MFQKERGREGNEDPKEEVLPLNSSLHLSLKGSPHGRRLIRERGKSTGGRGNLRLPETGGGWGGGGGGWWGGVWGGVFFCWGVGGGWGFWGGVVLGGVLVGFWLVVFLGWFGGGGGGVWCGGVWWGGRWCFSTSSSPMYFGREGNFLVFSKKGSITVDEPR